MNIFRYIFIGLISLYKMLLSPLLPAACRFTPTCSDYGIQAFKKHGTLKGIYLTAQRILSCHPWGRHGYDPVPDTFSYHRTKNKQNEINE